MKFRLKIALLSILLSAISSYGQSVGLVLSGGGAKGIAHIGVIKALEDYEIPIDYITGTSMGAIVGGLYASGYTPEEMMELILSPGFAHWSTGQVEEKYKFYFSEQAPSPEILTLNLNLNDSARITSNILPKSLINPLSMNFAFIELFSAITAQSKSNFDNLFVPYRCIGSDVYNKHKVVFSSGDLGDAIRASMTFPIAFKPIKINGIYMFDGGIYDNFPIDVMRSDFAPDFMLGIDVSSGNSDMNEDNLIDQIETMIIQPQNDSISPDLGLKIHINLKRFGLLDFAKAKEIYDIGYHTAVKHIEEIKSRVTRTMPNTSLALKRHIFNSHTPEIKFATINVTGGTDDQNNYIKYIFNKNSNGDTISLNEAKESYYRAISTNKISDLVPQVKYDRTTGLFDMNMQMTVKDNFSIGAGGFLTSSTNSMIYLASKYRTLKFNSFDGRLAGWIGQSYYAGELNAKIALRTSTPTEVRLQGVVSKTKFYESDILFYSDELPSFVLNYENYIRIKFGVATSRKSKLEFGIGYGYLKDKFYPTNTVNFTEVDQDESRHKLGQLYASWESNTLNRINYPTRGYSFAITATGILGKYKFLPTGVDNSDYSNSNWAQIRLKGDRYWNIANHFTLGAKADIVASTKKLYYNYTTSIVQAPAFCPTPSSQNYFNPAFRANSYAAAGILPIFNISESLQLRSEFYIFMPFRKIIETSPTVPVYGNWFSDPSYIAEASVVYSFPFAELSLYGNYLSYPAKNWNFGISFGIMLPAQKFIK